eukprot:4249832-Pleurochrysis_carterae.AAC.1
MTEILRIKACCCVGAAVSQTILSMSMSSPKRSRKKTSEARSDAPHDTPVLRPPFRRRLFLHLKVAAPDDRESRGPRYRLAQLVAVLWR